MADTFRIQEYGGASIPTVFGVHLSIFQMIKCGVHNWRNLIDGLYLAALSYDQSSNRADHLVDFVGSKMQASTMNTAHLRDFG